MKKVLVLIAVLSSFAFAKGAFIYNVKTDLLDEKSKAVVGEIYEGTPVEVVKKDGDLTLIKVKGEQVDGNATALAYKSAPLITFLNITSGEAKSGAKYFVKSSDLSQREYPSWEEVELVYYDTCTSCHAGHHPAEHAMNEWDAYLSAMQYFAKINDAEKARILRFLQAHAKDGIAKEEE
ncbi:hypothetical protein [Campylobacter geochelonis]|uniref:Cytochrome C family protein n=1 Tax=Campylobacter geochelonis TaxID=1780362 RepID=A0A128EK02_9BACT|nr:hypothetical protein [Campylobacter geochelonis]QKF71601.1 molybdopterin-containing oxidoreductase I, DMSO/TMAO/BSO reductase family, monoheme c-type cytochrome [Campylobacter geochelonis]CZE48671.1 Cytochrome C family protein [Campylobacter geochelonis]CZE48732.1 Cytochrome C family protein [Campylobacter geochelonis]